MLRYTAASKIGNSVISLLWQLQCRCNPDHNKFSSYCNTTVVAIFPKLCLWRRSLCSNLGGISLEKQYRATLKSTSPQWIKNLNPDTVVWHWSGDALFWTFQLTIAWMSNIKLKTNCICLGLQASKCDTVSRMWHSKRGGGRTDRFSHILLPRRRKCFARERVPLKFVLCLLPRNTFVIMAHLH